MAAKQRCFLAALSLKMNRAKKPKAETPAAKGPRPAVSPTHQLTNAPSLVGLNDAAGGKRGTGPGGEVRIKHRVQVQRNSRLMDV